MLTKTLMIRVYVLFVGLFLSNIAFSDNSFSLYGGIQSSPHSGVSGKDELGNNFDFTAGWEGRSFSSPPYYGLRYTKWNENNGFSVDFSHSKVYADGETLEKTGFKTLEFTDGLNVLTLNYLKRSKYKNFNFYWGLGGGVTLPHVEVQTSANTRRTHEYQFGGYALQGQFGLEKEIANNWSIFSEYKFNYTINNIDLDGGGKLKTNIVTNALNLGVSYNF